jgi:hypothetical protein
MSIYTRNGMKTTIDDPQSTGGIRSLDRGPSFRACLGSKQVLDRSPTYIVRRT